MKTPFRTIVWSYGTSLLNFLNTILVTLIAFPIIARQISLDEFGLLSIITATVTAVTLAQSGLDTAFSLLLTPAVARGDWETAARLWRQSNWINTRLAVLLALAFLTLGGVIVEWNLSTTVPPKTIFILLTLIGAHQSMLLLIRSDQIALYASQLVWKTNLIRLGSNITGSLCSIALAWSGYGLFALTGGELIANVLIFLSFRAVSRARCLWLQLRPPEPWKGIGQTVRFGMTMMIVIVLNMLESACEPWLFDLFIPGGLVFAGTYLLWMRLPLILNSFGTQLIGSAHPTLQSQYSVDREFGRAFFARVFAVVSWISVMIGFGVSAWLVPVLSMWIGPEILQYGNPSVAMFIGGAIALKSLFSMIATLIVFGGRSTAVLLISAVLLILKCGIALLGFRSVDPLFAMSFAGVASLLGAYLIAVGVAWYAGEITLLTGLFPLITLGFALGLGRWMADSTSMLSVGTNLGLIALTIAAFTIPISFCVRSLKKTAVSTLTPLEGITEPAHG